MARLFLPSVLFLLLVGFPGSAQATEAWPTTQFKVFGGNPVIGGNQVLDAAGIEMPEFEDQFFAVDPEVIQEVERAFHEAALWYQSKGFPPPELERVADGSAYLVYLCSDEIDEQVWGATWGLLVGPENAAVASPYSRCGYDLKKQQTSAGLYLPQCGNDKRRSKIMIVNSDKALDSNGKLHELGYQTIAHELMHAIMANSVFARSDPECKVTGWIGEGIPDAISFDIAEELWAGRYTLGMTSADVAKRDGYRPYLESLPQEGDVPVPIGGAITATYTTSSFWRYLADSHADGWGFMITPDKPDASLGFLDIGVSISRGVDGEVNWLNDGLHTKFARSLADMYARFVNLFAFQIAPVQSFQGKPAKESFEPWVKMLFGDCANVNLSMATSQTITLNLKKLASACIWVEPTLVAGLVQVTFQAMDDDETLFKDITIGRSDTGLLSRAAPIARVPSGGGFYEYQYLATWRDFPQDGALKTLYVVSNVAASPTSSLPRQITLTVSRPANTNSALTAVPLPAAPVAAPPVRPSYNKHAKKLSQQKRDTQKMVEEQMELDKESLNPNVSRASTIKRYTNKHVCSEPFKYNACGPQVGIFLSLMPGTYITPGATNAQGGIAAQTFGGLMAMSQTSMFDTQETMQRLAAKIESIDGSQVNILTPMFEFGQTPTFNNAAISVDMSGGRTWHTIGPPDEQGRTRLTGTVSIHDFTPFVISGSFSAPLAETTETGYVSHGTVTGTFTSVAPWTQDDRVSILAESNEQMADDIANTLGIPAGMINKMKRDGTMPGSTPGGQNLSASGALVTGQCDCECKSKSLADELCELMCEEEFTVCDGN